MSRVDRPVYALQLRALPHVVDDLRALRGALKRLKRDLGFQCLSVVEVGTMANKRGVDKTIERMRAGRLDLCIYYLFDDTPVFALSDGERIPETIAMLLIRDRHLIAVGEPPFAGALASVYRYVGS
jgi:hypothetical protein